MWRSQNQRGRCKTDTNRCTFPFIIVSSCVATHSERFTTVVFLISLSWIRMQCISKPPPAKFSSSSFSEPVCNVFQCPIPISSFWLPTGRQASFCKACALMFGTAGIIETTLQSAVFWQMCNFQAKRRRWTWSFLVCTCLEPCFSLWPHITARHS